MKSSHIDLGFDYKKYSSLNELIFEVDNYINEEGCYNE